MLDLLASAVPSDPPSWRPPADWNYQERWVQDIADRAAERAISRQIVVLGIDDVGEFRRNMDYLAGLREAEEARRSEGRKTTFVVIGGVLVAAAGWVVSLLVYLWNGHR